MNPYRPETADPLATLVRAAPMPTQGRIQRPKKENFEVSGNIGFGDLQGCPQRTTTPHIHKIDSEVPH